MMKHKGFGYERTKYPYHNERKNLEKIFADEWEKENKKNRCLNFGNGTLQDLFCHEDGIVFHVITQIEAKIVATVIQWLGSNCGFVFLEECLNKGGYKIIEKPAQESKP